MTELLTIRYLATVVLTGPTGKRSQTECVPCEARYDPEQREDQYSEDLGRVTCPRCLTWAARMGGQTPRRTRR